MSKWFLTNSRRMWLPRLFTKRSGARLSLLRWQCSSYFNDKFLEIRRQAFIFHDNIPWQAHKFTCKIHKLAPYHMKTQITQITCRQMSSKEEEVVVNLPMIRKMERICRLMMMRVVNWSLLWLCGGGDGVIFSTIQELYRPAGTTRGEAVQHPELHDDVHLWGHHQHRIQDQALWSLAYGSFFS